STAQRGQERVGQRPFALPKRQCALGEGSVLYETAHFGAFNHAQSRKGESSDIRAPRLERVVQAELNVSFLGANAADCTEVAVTDPVVRISVTGDIEKIEEVSTEAQHSLLAPQAEVLEEGGIDA